MIIENIKGVKILGNELIIEYSDNANKVDGIDGQVHVSEDRFIVRESLPKYRKSHTLWHEIIHLIDKYLNILNSGKELTDEEVDRIATGLQSLEFTYSDNEK